MGGGFVRFVVAPRVARRSRSSSLSSKGFVSGENKLRRTEPRGVRGADLDALVGGALCGASGGGFEMLTLEEDESGAVFCRRGSGRDSFDSGRGSGRPSIGRVCAACSLIWPRAALRAVLPGTPTPPDGAVDGSPRPSALRLPFSFASVVRVGTAFSSVACLRGRRTLLVVVVGGRLGVVVRDEVCAFVDERRTFRELVRGVREPPGLRAGVFSSCVRRRFSSRRTMVAWVCIDLQLGQVEVQSTSTGGLVWPPFDEISHAKDTPEGDNVGLCNSDLHPLVSERSGFRPVPVPLNGPESNH